jgi:hypothetical protein
LIPDSAVVLSDEAAVLAAVAGNKYAIGVTWAFETPGAVKFLTVDSVAPSVGGNYILARPLVIVGEDIEALTAFAVDTVMQDIVRGLGLWPIK